ncbi:MAG: PEP-CTERM sorting domain-containing protein [Aureliella sp.]
MTTLSSTFINRLSLMVDLPGRLTQAAMAAAMLTAIVSLAMPSKAQADIVITMVGTPGFDVVDAHLFTAPTATYFPDILPSHAPTRVVHSGYGSELSTGIANAGFQEKTVFSVSDFSAPNAVMLGFAMTPNALAPTGSSFDFANGPIISAAGGLPTGSGDVYLNGNPYEISAFGIGVAPDGFDGVSHIVGAVWENSTFAPPGLTSLVGDYEYRLTIRDSSNNGYNVLGSFSVAVPEPSAMLGLLGATALFSMRRRRVL